MVTKENDIIFPCVSGNNEVKGSVLAVIITYQPDRELLYRNIHAFINHVDKLMIWDNTPGTLKKKYYEEISEDKIFYAGVEENVGISKALNYALKYAISERYEYLLTMDQDSVWFDFSFFKDSVIKKNENELCICGPCAYTDIHNRPNKNGFEPYRWQITSGMFVKTELLNRIGGYNESFFVDCVDIELCLRAKSQGINSYYCYDGFLLQKYGIPSKAFFFGKERNYIFYSPFRVRGIIGGHIILYRRYKHPDLPGEIKRYTKEVIKSIVYSKKQPFKLSFALLKGFYDGIFKKYRY